MSASLLKHDKKKTVHQRSKLARGNSSSDDENDFSQLFPKCKPRLVTSPSEVAPDSAKCLDFNANDGLTPRSNCLKTCDLNNSNVIFWNKTTAYPGNVNRESSGSESGCIVGVRGRNDNMEMKISDSLDPNTHFPSTGNSNVHTESELKTPIFQSSGLLKDSRIEIAGGRELFSQSRNRVGRRTKEQQLRLVPGPKKELVHQNEDNQRQHSTVWEPNESDIPTEMIQSSSRMPNSYGRNQESAFSLGRSESDERHHFPCYNYDESGATTKGLSHSNSGQGRRSRLHREVSRTTTFPQVHATSMTIKETVFGSEITSIEKCCIGDENDHVAHKQHGREFDDLEGVERSPLIYETPSSSHYGGEVVFDDIDDHETEENNHRSSKLIPSRLDDTSKREEQKVFFEEGDSSFGYETSGAEANEKNLYPDQKKRLIGALPIADYERSPKRYGLQTRHGFRSCSGSTLRLQPRASSPTNLVPRMPGFPQRITQEGENLQLSPISPKHSVEFETENENSKHLSTQLIKSIDICERREGLTEARFPIAPATCDSEQPVKLDRDMECSVKNVETNEMNLGISEHKQDSDMHQYQAILSTEHEQTDPYLYEFSETKKVLEEFFKGGTVGAAYITSTLESDEVDYILKRQAGNSYVGQRLAGEVSLAEESPKLPPKRGGREVVMSLDLNSRGSVGSANGSSLRLITFHEVSRSSFSPGSRSSQQGDVDKDVNDNDIETTSTHTETDFGETEVGIHVGQSRNYTMSPETTDCDSNELESEMSLDYEASVHSSCKVGTTMPILEDGLSSGNVSEAEDDTNTIRKKKVQVEPSLFTSPPNSSTTSLPSNNTVIHGTDSISNPTVLLMKKQISEIEKEIRMRATQHSSQYNGGISATGMHIQLHRSQPCDILSSKETSSTVTPGTHEGDVLNVAFDTNDPELEALDPMRPTPPPSPAPGSSDFNCDRSLVNANSASAANSASTSTINGLPENLKPGSDSVSAALKDIKEALQKTKHLHNSNQIPRFEPEVHKNQVQSLSSQISEDKISSPIWVPRKSSRAGTTSLRQNQSGRSLVDSRVRQSLLGKPLYEEVPADDVSDADTDQETDRLLGQNRIDDDYGFYDEKEKENTKKKRSKEDLLKNSTVLIEGVLFRARYLGSTQLECEGQPTKATRMIQAEEAVSRIKSEETNQKDMSLIETCAPPEKSNTSQGSIVPKKKEESCIGCEYEDYLYALGGDESEDDSYEEYYGRKSLGNRLGLKLSDDNKKLDGRSNSLTFHEPLNSSNSSSSSSNAAVRTQRANSCGIASMSKVSSPTGSASSPSSAKITNSISKSVQQPILPFHLSPPCGSALPGTMFHLKFVGSLEVEEESGLGRKRRKRPKKIMVEEAVTKLKAPEGETQPSTEVDLFISTEKIMVLNTDLKEIMMDHALRTISYIADIGDLVVLMARRRPIPTDTPDEPSKLPRPPKMICHVFESDEAQYIAQSIGQAFQVAYMEFLKANGIEDHSFVREMDYQEVLNSQEIFGDELQMFAKKELQKDVVVPKTKGEILGVVIVESGWGSMLPTVVIANLAPAGAAARCGQLNIGDQIIAINGVSLVGLPLSTCQNYIKNSKTQTVVKLTVVPCPPVVEVKIKRPDTKYQLGFSVQNGVICSLLRGGIAERGGVRVGHRIIEINNQSVVAVPHEKIVNLLATSVGEINMKTMPTSMFRLLTGQETPLYI